MKLTSDQLVALRQLAERATPGPRQPFQLGVEGDERPANALEQIVYVRKCIEIGNGPYIIVNVDKADGRYDLCHTGNGPTSWENAEHIAAFDRETCLALFDELEASRVLAIQAVEWSHSSGSAIDNIGMVRAVMKYENALARYRGEKDGE